MEPPQQRPVTRGVQTIVGALVTLLTGFVYDLGGGYAPLFAGAGAVCCLAGAALVFIGAPPRALGRGR